MKHWSDKGERGSEWLIRLIVWLARTIGRSACRGLLYPIVLYFVVTDRTARQASTEFLAAANRHPARWRDVFAHVYSFAATLLDRVYMSVGDFDRFVVHVEGAALVERALETGRGCVLLGSHLGSFDMMALAGQSAGVRRVNIMMRVDPRSRVRRLAGVNDNVLGIIPLGQPDCFLRAHDLLTRGEIVAVLADRGDGKASLPVRFLGRETVMPVAPHILAASSGAPTLMCFGLYEGGNRYRIEFVECGVTAPPRCRGSELLPYVERYAAMLERYALLYPKNWFNFYSYWDADSKAKRK